MVQRTLTFPTGTKATFLERVAASALAEGRAYFFTDSDEFAIATGPNTYNIYDSNAKKNVANGFAGLDASGKLLSAVSSSRVDLSVFTASGNFSKDADDLFYHLVIINGGTGGNSGRSHDTSSNRQGGIGGRPGRFIELWLPASMVDPTTSVIIGAGGAGGIGIAGGSANGVAGGMSSFGLISTGINNVVHSVNPDAHVAGGFGFGAPAATGTYSGAGDSGYATKYSGGGGGGSGSGNGGDGGLPGIYGGTGQGGGAAGAATNGTAGSDGTMPGEGGGGARGIFAARGGHGTAPGGGGGGGSGGASASVAGGDGGNGARGEVRVYRFKR